MFATQRNPAHRLRVAVLIGWIACCVALFTFAIWLNGGVGPVHVRSAAWTIAFAFGANSAFCIALLCVPAVEAWASADGRGLRGDRSGLVVAAVLTAATAVGVLVDLAQSSLPH